MNKVLNRRLQRLEQSAVRQRAASSVCPSPARQIIEWLDSIGIVREPMESLAEMTARAMGITPRELQEELRQRAAGIAG